jgi:hypothetical protein
LSSPEDTKARGDILGSAGDVFGGDARTCAGYIFNSDLLAKEVGSAVTEGPRCYVGSRSWREADNEADGTRRVGLLGIRCATQKWQRDSTDCQLKLASPVVHNHSSISVAIVNRRLWQEIVPIAATRIT